MDKFYMDQHMGDKVTLLGRTADIGSMAEFNLGLIAQKQGRTVREVLDFLATRYKQGTQEASTPANWLGWFRRHNYVSITIQGLTK